MTDFYPQNTLDEINRRLDIRRLMQSIDYRFEKYQEGPKTAKGFCPIHREGLFRNLVIDVEARTFRCQYTQCPGSKGGTLVSLYSQACNIDIDVAARRIAREQDLDVDLPVNHEQVAAQLAVADELLEQEKLDDAEVQYHTILDEDPENAEAHHGLLKIYEARGNTEGRAIELVQVCRLKIAAGKAAEIADLIQEWSESDSDSPDARFAFAELLVAKGDAESAVMELMGGGDACEAQGEMDAAIHAYKRAAAISAENQIDVIDVTPHIIRVLTQLDRTSEAVKYLYSQADKANTNSDFEAATELSLLAIEVDPSREESHRRFLLAASTVDPTDVISRQVLESVAFIREQGDGDGAMQALESYAVVAPGDEQVIRGLINEFNNHGRAEEAFDLEARLARLLHSSGREDEALEIINNVLTWQPQHVGMLDVFVEILRAKNDTGEARETLRRLIRALSAQGRHDEALSRIEEMGDASDPDVQELRADALEGMARTGDKQSCDQALEALKLLADTHLEESTGRRAVGYLQRAIDLTEEPPNDLLFKLARAHLRNKDYVGVRDTVITVCENLASEDRLDEAILEAERYSNLIPDDTDLVRYLVELYLRFDDKPAAVARMRRLADDLQRSGRQEEADEVIEQANDLEPQNLDTIVRQLDHYLETGNIEKAQQARLRIATFHEEAGNTADAITSLEEYLREAPQDVSVIARIVKGQDKLENGSAARQWRLQLARAYRATGDNDREARVLRDVLANFSDDEEVLNLLMTAEFARGDMQAGASNAMRLAALQRKVEKPESARKTLMKAVERVPDNLDINREIYNHHLEGKQTNQAVAWGKKLIKILTTAGKNSDAATIFDKIASLDPDNLALKQEQLSFLEETGRNDEVLEKRLALADVYRNQERFNDAEALLEAVIKTDSRNLKARRQLADLCMHLGETAKGEAQLLQIAGIHHLEHDSPQAIKMLQEIIAVNPSHLDAHRQLAQIYRAEGDPTAAVSILLDLSDLYRKQGMETEAFAAEREALELDPGNETIWRRVIDSLKDAGRIDKACDQLEKLVQRQMDHEQYEAALETCNEVIEFNPARLSARKYRAELWKRLGDPEKAFVELQELAELALQGVAPTPAPVSAGADAVATRPGLQIVPEYTFETFVVGTNNDFAYATALAIARSPARAYNPLFLYANVGLGKTHLCNAIANYLLERDPSAGIIYTNSEDFTDELVNAIQNNAVQEFRTRYRSLDLLIVDDVQFLTGKERAQEEFFHIFNNLFQAKRQIVITSDRPPAEIAHLESRLRSRFGAGVIVDIASPDLETRLAILNREVNDNSLNLESWVPRMVAEKVDTNVRDLKGALNQVVATRDLRKQKLTENSVGEMLDALYPAASV